MKLAETVWDSVRSGVFIFIFILGLIKATELLYPVEEKPVYITHCEQVTEINVICELSDGRLQQGNFYFRYESHMEMYKRWGSADYSFGPPQ